MCSTLFNCRGSKLIIQSLWWIGVDMKTAVVGRRGAVFFSFTSIGPNRRMQIRKMLGLLGAKGSWHGLPNLIQERGRRHCGTVAAGAATWNDQKVFWLRSLSTSLLLSLQGFGSGERTLVPQWIHSKPAQERETTREKSNHSKRYPTLFDSKLPLEVGCCLQPAMAKRQVKQRLSRGKFIHNPLLSHLGMSYAWTFSALQPSTNARSFQILYFRWCCIKSQSWHGMVIKVCLFTHLYTLWTLSTFMVASKTRNQKRSLNMWKQV